MSTSSSLDTTATEVIVLGGAGFLGRHVGRALSQRGCRVVGLGHGGWSPAEWQAWGYADWHDADISLDALDRLPLEGVPRCVIHCGGSGAVSYSYQQPLQDFRRAVQSAIEVLEWARLQGQKTMRVVLTSSAAVYGDRGETDATEASARAPISPYGVHKMAAEQICESYSRFFDVPTSTVRLFSVYGAGLRKQLLWDAMNKFQRGEAGFMGTGHEVRDWIHVEDAARLLTEAGLAPQGTYEIYNGGGEHAAIARVVTHLASLAGSTAPVSFSGEVHTGNPRRLTSDCSHARRLLGWEPRIRLEQGLADYVDWYLRQARPREVTVDPASHP